MTTFHQVTENAKRIIAAVLVLLFLSLPFLLTPLSLTANTRPPSVIHNVPFSMQVPMGEWSDPRQQDGCEETTLLMAMTWARGGTFIHPEEARRDIVNISEYERVIFGFYQDTSITDTAQLLQDYYNHKNFKVQFGISSENIKNELAAGNVVALSLNTRLTKMPIYAQGPVRHTILAVGYDDQTDEIIVHDPFLKQGKYLHIKSAALNQALWDYNSGIHLPSGPKRSAMISIGK